MDPIWLTCRRNQNSYAVKKCSLGVRRQHQRQRRKLAFSRRALHDPLSTASLILEMLVTVRSSPTIWHSLPTLLVSLPLRSKNIQKRRT